MITIRFASGFSIQYNTAGHVTRDSAGGWADLYTEKGGLRIAHVPISQCVMEFDSPDHRTYMAGDEVKLKAHSSVGRSPSSARKSGRSSANWLIRSRSSR